MWEAVLHPTDAYDSRCSCCPLLRSPQSAAREAEAGGQIAVVSDHRYADAYRVRLDVGTGVCVRTEQIGGDADGAASSCASKRSTKRCPSGSHPAATGSDVGAGECERDTFAIRSAQRSHAQARERNQVKGVVG